MEQVLFNSSQISQSILEYGFTVVASAIFLLMSITILFFFIKWFVRIVNNIIDRQQQILNEILLLQKEQHRMIKGLKCFN